MAGLFVKRGGALVDIGGGSGGSSGGSSGVPTYIEGELPAGATPPYLVLDPNVNPVSLAYEDGGIVPLTWGPATSGYVADSGSFTPTMPAHETGDLIIFMGYRNDSGGLSGSGFSALVSSSTSRHHVMYKVATSSAEAPTFTGSGGAYVNWIAQVVKGGARYLVDFGQPTTGVSNTDNLQGAELVGYYVGNYSSSVPTPAAGTTLLKDQSGPNASSAAFKSDSVTPPIPGRSFGGITTGISFGIKRS